jgi:RNA polymerase sigma-70 factor (ECF subfamily)
MTDEELAARYVAARDPADFRALVERNAPLVLRLVASIFGPFRDADAEETAQDVFLRAHGKLGQFRGDSKFATWLYRLAYNVAANRARLSRFRLPHVAVEALRDVAEEGSPHDDAVASERAAVVAAAVESLPDLYRTTIYLHYWLETPIEEIASLIGAPPNTVKSYLFRARQRIARILAEKGITS